MGVEFQKSCYLVPKGSIYSSNKKHMKAGVKRKLVRKRKGEMREMLCEVRLWVATMLIPSDYMSADRQLSEEKAILNRSMFGATPEINAFEHFEHVFRKLVKRVAIPGISTNPQHAHDECDIDDGELLRRTDNDYPPVFMFEYLNYHCPDFCSVCPDAKTWLELREGSKRYQKRSDVCFGYKVDGWSLTEWLRCMQLNHAKLLRGFAFEDKWSYNQRKLLRHRLSSRMPWKFEDSSELSLPEHDAFVVRYVPETPNDGRIAEATEQNIITLFPRFFSMLPGLKDIELSANGFTDARMQPSSGQVLTFLHELLHCSGVLNTTDHILEYTNEELWEVLMPHKRESDDRFPQKSHQPQESDADSKSANQLDWWFSYAPIGVSEPRNIVVAYGLESCLDLAARPSEYPSSKPFDNSDSIALAVQWNVYLHAYPDFDVLSARWDVQVRERLIHHCSLFDCMRHPTAGSICDHPDYDESKDPWSASSGKQKPKTITELLKIVEALV